MSACWGRSDAHGVAAVNGRRVPGADWCSDMTDSDADQKRRGLRRGQRQDVNYCEVSDSSDSRASAKRREVKLLRRHRKEHLSSDFSDGWSHACFICKRSPGFSCCSSTVVFSLGSMVGAPFSSSSSFQPTERARFYPCSCLLITH